MIASTLRLVGRHTLTLNPNTRELTRIDHSDTIEPAPYFD